MKFFTGMLTIGRKPLQLMQDVQEAVESCPTDAIKYA
jgi:ferredoxin